MGHKRVGQLLTLPSEATKAQSSFLTAAKVSITKRAVLMGLSFHPKAAAVRVRTLSSS